MNRQIRFTTHSKTLGPEGVSVRNLQRKIPVNVAELETFAGNAVKRCLQLRKRKRTRLRKLNAVAVWLISDRRMSKLHLQVFGDSDPTDVITFHDGEIFISVETARRNAREFCNSLMSEIKFCIVHGFLHLHGFDDRMPADARKMKNTQEKILRDMGIRIGIVPQI
ncbi:MAG TPA: rRNA maturation RNase YbeY [Candidatus Udaeobacter sp.]|nr:rRNA maturation RNase YbeY [Candidatus Udaeobacter sp.]